jgi:hypothetical protein
MKKKREEQQDIKQKHEHEQKLFEEWIDERRWEAIERGLIPPQRYIRK